MGCISTRKRRPGNTAQKRNRLYRIWKGMRDRCDRAGSPYNKKGISYDPRWSDFRTFKEDMQESYLAHVHRYSEINTSLDRIDFRGNYSKENCRWATRAIQSRNRSSNRFLAYNGKKLTIAEWGQISGIPASVIRERIKLGWTMQKALSIPVRNWSKQ